MIAKCDGCGALVPSTRLTDEYEERDLCPHCVADAKRHAAEGSSNREAAASWDAYAAGLAVTA